MKSVAEWAQEWARKYFRTDTTAAAEDFIRAIQADALKTVQIGIISMMGAEPWSKSQMMGDEIIHRINQIMPKDGGGT